MRLGFTTLNQSQREHQWSGAIPPHHAQRSSNLSSLQVMVTMFWDSVGVILVDFMSKGATINSDVYINTLKKLKVRIQRVRPALEMSKVLLQHDNAWPHTSLKTHEVISSFGWRIISHTPYLPNLAPCDFHLFRPHKKSLRGDISPVMKRSKLVLGSG